jgi:hypothetical protein
LLAKLIDATAERKRSTLSSQVSPVFKYSPSARAENANSDLRLFFRPMVAIDIWLSAMSVAVEWNGKILKIVTTLNKDWLDLANRRLAAYMALPQYLGACRSYQAVYSVYAEFSRRPWSITRSISRKW